MTRSKSELRRQLKAKRLALKPLQQQLAARRVAEKLQTLPALTHIHHLGFYSARGGEVSLHLAMTYFAGRHVNCYLPEVLPRQKMVFRRWSTKSPLRSNRFNIAEVKRGTAIAPVRLDAVLVPLVGFDDAGNRLGMGGGFYDRAFAGRPRPLMIGIAHRCQRSNSPLPLENWDVPMDLVVSV